VLTRSRAHSQQGGGFNLGVLLNDDSGEYLPIERSKLVDAFFDVEDEDDGVFEGADGPA
jgi:hypothetical protein